MGKPYTPRVKMRAELPSEDMSLMSVVGRKVLREYTEAHAEYEEMGAHHPDDHAFIEREWKRAKRAMISYLIRLEADKIVRSQPHKNAVFATADMS